eukprot:scaffold7591_cov132-Isochrysis_galbana.AAC.3
MRGLPPLNNAATPPPSPRTAGSDRPSDQRLQRAITAQHELAARDALDADIRALAQIPIPAVRPGCLAVHPGVVQTQPAPRKRRRIPIFWAYAHYHCVRTHLYPPVSGIRDPVTM